MFMTRLVICKLLVIFLLLFLCSTKWRQLSHLSSGTLFWLAREALEKYIVRCTVIGVQLPSRNWPSRLSSQMRG